MHVVDGLFSGPGFRTEVLISERAAKELAKQLKRDHLLKRFLKALEHYARAGFARFEGEKNPIRYEGEGVWRVAYEPSLFRLIGFYEDEGKTTFVAIDAFKKRGQRLSGAHRARIKEVARVRREGGWRRKVR